MKNLKNYHYLLFALLTLFVSSCNLSDIIDDDDDDMDDDPDTEIMSAKINGDTFMAVESDNTLIQLDDVDGDLDLTGDVYELTISGLDFGNTHLTTITLSLQGDNYSSLMVGDEFVGITEESVSSGNPTGATGVVAKASLGGGTTEFGGLTLFIGTINVKITKLDKENERISGEFSFLAYDEEDGFEINVTEGVFTDVEF
ncbi:hypothetical protein [Cyclobacterium qasimii]|uniref:Lipocalin-like domain-containing protein n=2 Tax=Cyclobacterium qasimii TaxID=1350429 RepID=S7WP55_9BACT|nr:hypothetical protein [Cyclobacterium qasimii]EPR65933.1 hypothetical protein ADICYQ_5078 [Cyclobacterium qasimii M12-11B]GEO23163.1 hypothetical protein CQA01_36970 [Cyclobacterium qasimii]